MSAIESTEIQESALELTTVLAAFKLYGSSDLFKVIRTATIEAEKRAKEESKGPKKPKGPTPHQLQKPKAWVQYVLNYSAENGWEQFICVNKKSGEEIVMPASEEKDGKQVVQRTRPKTGVEVMMLDLTYEVDGLTCHYSTQIAESDRTEVPPALQQIPNVKAASR